MDLQTQRLMMAAAGAVGGATYVDDVFSTDLWTGTGSAVSIDTGVDMTDGGMVWVKPRASGYHNIIDTERGVTKVLYPNVHNDQDTDSGGFLASFDNNGYNLVSTGSGGNYFVGSGDKYVGWSFKKTPGFFDVVTYTGNGSSQNISHSLGCIPGCYMIKRTDANGDWKVFHRSLKGPAWYLNLNETQQEYDLYSLSNNTAPTASVFTVGSDSTVNANSGTYVAYVFAGGESTAATAVSVDFDGNDHLDVATSSDLDLGTGDFTIEFWAKFDGTNTYLECCFDGRHPSNTNNGIMVARWHSSGHENKVSVYMGGFLCEEQGSSPDGQWNHYAVVRASGTTTLYKNGKFEDSFSDSNDWSNDTWNIACLGNDEGNHDNAMRGWISNFRVVKGTAVYTSSFRPPTEPLTNITNTKLLCCQSSTVTASTGVTLSANGNPAASTDSPFYDLTGFVFGKNEDQNVIKCGSYVGNGNADGPEIYVGWEPSWLLIKRSSGTEDWMLFDHMRTSDRTDMHLDDVRPNKSNAESDGAGGDSNSFLNWTPTGFKLQSNTAHTNDADDTYVYMAIRRSDGYVGKPPSLGTDVFAMDTGNGSSDIPAMDSGFPVDFALKREPASSNSWRATARLIGAKGLFTDTIGAEYSASSFVWDSNVGWLIGASSSEFSWMWKRHAGFDVVCYKGNGNVAGGQIAHSLNAVPEMIWLKNRDETRNWAVYHKGLNGGTDPEDYYIYLSSSASEYNDAGFWNDTMPTSTHFTLGTYGEVSNAQKYIALLFASVDGICKVGYYTGTSSSPSVTITTGFSPRLLIIKRADGTRDWNVFDTVRGIGTGTSDDKRLLLSSNAAQNSGSYVNVTSTGFTVQSVLDVGTNGGKYIYYAHA